MTTMKFRHNGWNTKVKFRQDGWITKASAMGFKDSKTGRERCVIATVVAELQTL